MTTLIDSGAQVSSISSQFCKELTLQIQSLGRLLELEGTGTSTIPYIRFMEVNLQIPGIKNYNEDVLLLVIPTTSYSEKVLVMVGIKIIDLAMRIIMKGELVKVTTTWKQTQFGTVMSGSLQLPHMGSNGTGVEKNAAPFSPRIDTMEVKEFYLDDVWGLVCTTWRVPIPLFSTISVNGNTVSKDTVCRSMCSQNQCQVPSCLQQWCQLQPMESYIWGPLRYPSVCIHWAPVPSNPHKDCGWSGHACQPSATGGPPDRDFGGIQQQSPKGMGLGGRGPPSPWGMALTWERTDLRTAAQMGTPVCPQWPGPG